MKLSNFIIYLAIALSFVLLISIAYTLTEEISELKARDRVLRKEIVALQEQITVIQDNIKHMNRPFTKVIPIVGGFLGIKEGCIK